MTTTESAEKWNKIYAESEDKEVRAAEVLSDNLHLLPTKGKALDLACGLGGNALTLAESGLETYAWDVSKEAIDKLRLYSDQQNISLHLETRDVSTYPPSADTFDIIVVSRFLDRTLIPHITAALRQNGLIYYQTFIKDKTSDVGPRNPAYRLDSNELLSLFQSLHILFYREEGSQGNVELGYRNEAMLIGCKNMPHD